MYEDYLFFTFMLFMALGIVLALFHTQKQLQTRENWQGQTSVFLVICVLLILIMAIILAFKRYFEERESNRINDISYCLEQYNENEFLEQELSWEIGPMAAWLRLRLLYMRPMDSLNDSNISIHSSLSLTDYLLI